MDVRDPVVIVQLHDALVEEFGGEKGLLSENLLFSALARPFHGLLDGTEQLHKLLKFFYAKMDTI